jgi:hypothetical protein
MLLEATILEGFVECLIILMRFASAGLNCLNADSLPPLFGQGAGVI